MSQEILILLLEIKIILKEIQIGYFHKDLMDKLIKILFLIIGKFNLIKVKKYSLHLNKLSKNGDIFSKI